MGQVFVWFRVTVGAKRNRKSSRACLHPRGEDTRVREALGRIMLLVKRFAVFRGRARARPRRFPGAMRVLLAPAAGASGRVVS